MKSILITGAGQGLGKALFDLYVSKGWKVFPVVRKECDVEELLDVGGNNCYPILADIRDNDVVDKITDALNQNTKTLDVLINNAGYASLLTGVLAMEASDLDGHFATNVTGAWKCAKACYPFLKESTNGIIINVSSRRGTFNFNKDFYERANPYKISKCALNMMSLLMDQEFSRERIRVFPVHPGALKTRVAPPDADTTSEQAAEKLFDFINTINQDTPFGLYDIIKEKYLEW